MTEELQQKLYDAYPDIFRQKDLDMRHTCMCWGINCDDGWYDLLERLCSKLQLISKASNIIIEASQVKEKFASLRFYTDCNVVKDANDPLGIKFDAPEVERSLKTWHEIIDSVISTAERESAHTCELCGAAGKQHTRNSWYKTLCKTCAEKNEYKPVDKRT